MSVKAKKKAASDDPDELVPAGVKIPRGLKRSFKAMCEAGDKVYQRQVARAMQAYLEHQAQVPGAAK